MLVCFFLPEFKKLVDGYFFDNWLITLKNHLAENASDVDRVIPYLEAFFPIIKYFYSTSNSLYEIEPSVSLRSIADKVKEPYSDLKNHINSLEEAILENMPDSIEESTLINKYLKLYLHYPLPDNIKNGLLTKLSQVPPLVLQHWIHNADFFYAPIDQFDMNVIGVDPRFDFIVSETDQENIRTFFVRSECKSILQKKQIDDTQQELVTVIRWAIITQDEDLFQKILNVLDKKIDQINLERLKHYITYLKNDINIQRQLVERLNNLLIETQPLTNNILSASLELEQNSYNQLAQDIFNKLNTVTQGFDEIATKQYILWLIEEEISSNPTIVQASDTSMRTSFSLNCKEIEENLFQFFSNETLSKARLVCKRWQNIASEFTTTSVCANSTPTFQK